MKQITSRLLACGMFSMLLAAVHAQVFYTQEFAAAGLPAGWTTADPSPNNVLWERCTNTTNNCVTLYGADPFAGTTAANGFMVLDSDGAGNLASAHVSQLTSAAIDCSGKNAVFAIFENYIGVFTTSADAGAILRVSTDLNNWTDFQIFEGIDAANELSPNPFLANIDISNVAANQPKVYLQWQWTGRYDYWWMLDGISLTTIDPFPNNLKIADFYYPVSSFATPASQLPDDVFGFSALVTNKGSNPQTNVKVYASVVGLNTDGTIAEYYFTDSVTLNTLPAGYQDSFIQFPNQYTPALTEGFYAVIYEVAADSADQRPGDNLDGDVFEVTNLRFAKENQATVSSRPSDGGDWAVGNYYRMGTTSQESYKAMIAEFTFSTDTTEIFPDDVVASVNLYKVNDDVEEDFSNYESNGNSQTVIGTGEYDAPDDMEDFKLQKVELFDIGTFEPGILLAPGGRYFLTVEYGGANQDVYHAFDTEVIAPFVSTIVRVGDEWNLAGFQGDPNAVLRLYLDLASKTDDTPLPEAALSVSPNPTSDFVNLQVQFEQPTDATITIADINGRVIRTEDRPGMTKDQVSYSIASLPAGTYLARIATGIGTRTLQFVVQK